MCGIAGYISKKTISKPPVEIDLLMDPIRRRGPDDEGVCLISRSSGSKTQYRTDLTVPEKAARLAHYKDEGAYSDHDIAFLHTRYSIIDLSEGGHQPFVSSDGSVICIFNGEIYNYIELKEELSGQGVVFKTTSDTEVLVEGYRVWGEGLWEKMNGFWAVALYDLRRKQLILSRDRIGVAPLYYRETPEGLFFSSAIQSLINIDGRAVTDDDVIAGFLETGIKDHDDTTFYSEVKSIPSRSVVTFDIGSSSIRDANVRRFWDFPQERMKSSDISFRDAVWKYHDTFLEAVKIRLRADVKVAFELSGGLDSSSCVAAAAVIKSSDITTYTAKIKGADEEPYARSMLKKYPIDYRVIKDIEDNFVKDHGKFSRLMEEPYDNPNDYTHNVMLQRMKGDGVHVVVTGAGGDEVLAGYESSFWPKAYLEMKSRGGKAYLMADWYEFCRRFKTLKTSYNTLKHYAVDPFKYMGKYFSKRSNEKDHTPSKARDYVNRYRDMTFHERALYHFNVALVPYYMRSSDHFTMGIPIEHRFPLLDYRIVELGLSMPPEYLFRSGWTKYLLRKAMQPYLPEKILWRRKKMGFTFPYKKYFAENKDVFKPYLRDVPGNVPGYDDMLKKNPQELWRYLSVSIWKKNNL